MRAALRSHWAFVALVVAHLTLKAALWPRVRDARLYGDENAYHDGARAMRNLVVDLVSGQGPDVAELKANVIGDGWLMPGQSILMAPLFLVAPDAGTATIRTYLGVVTSAVLIATALACYRTMGRRYGLALLVVPGLLPMWVIFSYTAWGDTSGGLLVVILLLVVVGLARRLAAGEPWRPVSALGLGALGAWTVYTRPSLLPLAVGGLVIAVAAVLLAARGRARWHGLGMAGVAAATMAALILPWSVAASRTLDARVVTTTTLRQSLAIAFGDEDELCFGSCGPGTIWFSSQRYAHEVGYLTGESQVEVMRRMSEHALADLTPEEYSRKVGSNAERFALKPTAYLARMSSPTPPETIAPEVLEDTSWALYALGGVSLVLATLAVCRRRRGDQVVSLLVTLFTAAIFLQPLLHISTGRYWPVFAPLTGVALGLLCGIRIRRPDPGDGVAVLTIAQTVAAGFVVSAVAGLAVLAL